MINLDTVYYVLIAYDGQIKNIKGVALSKKNADKWLKDSQNKFKGWYSEYMSLTYETTTGYEK